MKAGLMLPVALLVFSTFLSLHLFLVLRGRAEKSRTVWILASIMGATATWSSLNVLELLAPDLATKFILGNLQYLPICAIPVLQFRFGTRLLYRDDDSKPKFRSASTLLWLEPLLTAALVWFDPILGLVRHDFRLDLTMGFPMLVRELGPWFWIHAIYDYVLIALGTVRVIIALSRGSQNGRAQAWILSLAALVPSIANVAYVVGIWPLPAMDPTPMAFSISGAAYFLTLSRFRFLALLPTAQHAAITGISEGVLILDGGGRIAFMNEAAGRILSLTRVDAGRLLEELYASHPLLEELPRGKGEEKTLRIGVDGDTKHIVARCESVRRGRTEIASVHTLHDITRRVQAEEELRGINHDLARLVEERTLELSTANEKISGELERRKETEKQLFYFSLHDPLTGLPNRSLLLNRLGQAIERLRRDSQPPFALIYIDFDNFKHVNDSYGHASGDAFLREAAARLLRAVRGVDTVSRLGGDEFVVLLDKVHSIDEALEVGDRIAFDLAVPIRFGSNAIVPSASLGILGATIAYASPEDLLRDADLAMYHAKAKGKNKRVVFDESMRTAVLEKTTLTNDLNKAILGAGIELHYQPIVDLADGSIAGCEALARWTHPELGRIGPDRFIPVAEEAGLIVPLGLFVLMEACRTAVLMKEITGSKTIFIAVNVSPLQLAQPDFAEILVSALERHGLGTETIHLEITESALVERSEIILPLLHGLRAKGFHFKLDDFGTGYSSLAYLHRFPISTIKIDQSFVRDIDDRAESEGTGAGEGILKGIISLGHELGKGIVAEGIETENQARALRSWGCDFGQGWLFGKPTPRELWMGKLAESIAKVK
ncbi:MAG: EAL domain-containing protein [Spirochaetota bacterium]